MAVAVAVGADDVGEGSLGKDKAFALTERTRPSTLGGDPSSGDMINFGHNERVTGVRKHHPSVRTCVWDGGGGYRWVYSIGALRSRQRGEDQTLHSPAQTKQVSHPNYQIHPPFQTTD